MGLITLLFTSLGLSMDACAVSITNGMCYNNIQKKQVLVTAFIFGFFQALMPIIGYQIGSTFSDFITFLDHWIALILLGIIGGKMICEAIKELKYPEACLTSTKILTFKTLILQAIATSIDALAVGISFSIMKVDIIIAALSIGIITFFNSVIGSNLGKRFGEKFKQKAEILGGTILIIIGVKIFLEHTIL
ncbi:manganese efflux pump MntP [Sedimentibacter sp. MB31-C6]|uniref:manganese efflux pump MntP n=1 Tax=Sedimentibacter sp. MB31-C6 TaxID=3109366 RepID=UPI002DDCC980|nr:manganese efflux pump MntP family protein [Sedimentibacter sp. MB36-C1]WSI03971.1 manganese efflux pump MntP family protein [Sedimentibacter sp. MB36-C1]